jgi:hypothetical protein
MVGVLSIWKWAWVAKEIGLGPNFFDFFLFSKNALGISAP